MPSTAYAVSTLPSDTALASAATTTIFRCGRDSGFLVGLKVLSAAYSPSATLIKASCDLVFLKGL